MRVAISGGTGFVGSRLVPALLDRGDEVTLIVRDTTNTSRMDPRARTAKLDSDAIARADAIVNLAGAGVLDERWTESRLRAIKDSRVTTTRALASAAKRARVFVSASAIGYYGMQTDDAALDEASPPGDDVLARICVDWEDATKNAHAKRIAIARIGIVLGRGGGALERMLPMFRAFVGGPLGSGKQWWSWIHIDDVVRAILFAIDTDTFEGAFNVTCDAPRTMNDVARALGKIMKRPSAIRVPAFALRVALGDAADVLLTGQQIVPKKLVASNFDFRFPTLELALCDILR